jgi:hypothetical protein
MAKRSQHAINHHLHWSPVMKAFAILLTFIVVVPAAHATTLMKPGLWEASVTKQVMDGKDMTAQMNAAQAQMHEQLSKMTPAQRQQMEKMMGGQKMPNMGAQRLCISPEMASQDKPFMPSDSKCEPVKYQRNGNKVTFELNCTSDGHATVGKGESVTEGDNVTSRMDMTITDARGRHTMQSESQMRYLGSDCQGIKPLDQFVKDIQPRKKP